MKKCVEIEKADDGTFTVTDCSKEEGPESQGMHQMPGGEMMKDSMMDAGGMQEGMRGMRGMGGMEPQGQSVPTLKDALMAAAEILSSGESGNMADKQAAFSSADERLTR